MEVHWTRHIPQAMQRHTGCAWVRPAAADEPKNKTRGSEEPRAAISEDEKKAA
jgi:hypothetical protein